MLKYDSMHGPYIGEVSFSGSDLVIDGKKIKSYSEKCVFPHLASFTLDKSLPVGLMQPRLGQKLGA